jgi:hypothetical protein
MRLVRDDVDVMEPQPQDELSEHPPHAANGQPVANINEQPDGAIDDAVADEKDGASADVQVDLRTLEALLFSTHHPLTAGRLAELLDLESTKPIRRAIKELNEQYVSGDRSFRVEQVAGGYQLLTVPGIRRDPEKTLPARGRRQAHQGRARDASDHRLQAADPAGGHRGDPRRGVRARRSAR